MSASHHSDWDGILEPDEYIIWQGRPHRSLEFERRMKIGFVIGAAATIGSVYFFRSSMSNSNASYVMAFVLIAAIAITLACPIFLLKERYKEQVTYSLSNKRGFIATVDSYGERLLEHHPVNYNTYVELKDGRAPSVIFVDDFRIDEDGKEANIRSGFEDIKDGLEVYKMMLRIRQGDT